MIPNFGIGSKERSLSLAVLIVGFSTWQDSEWAWMRLYCSWPDLIRRCLYCSEQLRTCCSWKSSSLLFWTFLWMRWKLFRFRIFRFFRSKTAFCPTTKALMANTKWHFQPRMIIIKIIAIDKGKQKQTQYDQYSTKNEKCQVHHSKFRMPITNLDSKGASSTDRNFPQTFKALCWCSSSGLKVTSENDNALKVERI